MIDDAGRQLCEHCGAAVPPSPRGFWPSWIPGTTPRFCDDACRRKHRRRATTTRPTTARCPTCGAAFAIAYRHGPPPVYCSERCSSTARTRRARARQGTA